MRKKLIILCIIIFLILIISIIVLVLLNNHINIFKFQTRNAEALQNDEFIKEVIDSDANNIYYLLKFIEQDGIQKIIKPDGLEIYANNKTKIAIDLTADPDKDYEFTVITSTGEKN